MKSLYSTYDNHKRGHITYKDFSDSLLLLNSGINKNDAYNLATNIDKHHCGVIEYSSILSALNQLKENSKPVAVEEGKSYDGDSKMVDVTSSANVVVSESCIESSEETKQPETLSLSVPESATLPVSNEPAAVMSASPSNIFTPKSFSTGHDTIKTSRKVGYRVHDNKFKINDQKFGVTDSSDNVKDEYRGLMKKKPYGNSQQVSSFNPYEYYDSSHTPAEVAEIPDPVTTDYYNRESVKTDEVLASETADTLAFVHDQTPVQRDINTIEHTIITQLNGNLVPVRQALKKKDISGSGYVNIHEFDSALGAAGVDALSKQDIHDVFTANTANTTQTAVSGIGYTAGKVVEIDEFITKLAKESVDSDQLPPKIVESSSHYKAIEERRVCKRVIDNAMKLNDYHGFFKHFCDHDSDTGTIMNGWMSKDQLKCGLEAAGMPISNRDMNILFDKLDTNHSGKVNLRDFDKMCIQSLEEGHKEHKAKKLTHSTKNNTFKSDFDLHYNHDNDIKGYDHLMKSKSYKQDDVVWSKLKHKIQSSPDVLLKTFQGPGNGWANNSPSRALSVPEMISRMNDLGVTLCLDDSYNIADHLRNELKPGISDTDGKITLDQVCKVFDIPMKAPPTVSSNKMKLVPPDEFYSRDGGTFGASHLSLDANDSSRTSFYDNDDPFPWIPNNRKKKVSSKYNNPNSVSTEYSHGHTGNFWKFENNNEIDIFRFGMYPLPSYRHTETSNSHDVSYSKERKQDATELYLRRATEFHSIRDDSSGGVMSQGTENEYSLNTNTRSKLKARFETSHIFDEVQHADTRGRVHYNNTDKNRRASSAPPGSRMSTQASSIVLGDADANMDTSRKFTLKKHPSSNNFNTTSFGKAAPYATEINSGTAAPAQQVPLHKFPIDHLTEASSGINNEIKSSLKMVGSKKHISSINIGGSVAGDANNSVRTYRKMVPNNSNIPKDQRPYGLDTDSVRAVV